MRPKFHHSVVTTPGAAIMMQLLGATHFGPVAFSGDQMRAIQKLYGFKREPANEKPAPPEAPKREDFDTLWRYEAALKEHEHALKRHARWEDPQALMQAGADRNAFRHAEVDGLRLIAWLAKYIGTGEDPLKTLIQIAVEAGFDVDPADCDWALSEDREDDEEDP